MSKMLDEAEYLRRVALLPREVAPAKDAWPLIFSRISQKAAGSAYRFRWWPAASAASFLIVLAAALLLKVYWNQSAVPLPVRDSVATTPVPQDEPHYAIPNSAAELEYRAALREFMALNVASGAAEGAKPKWIEQGWDTLRQVELELAAALRDDPNNKFLISRMAVLRGRQVELLRQIAAVEETSWRNSI